MSVLPSSPESSRVPRALASLVQRGSSLRSVGSPSEGSSSVCSLAPELPLLFHTPHALILAHRAKKVESKIRTECRISGASLLLVPPFPSLRARGKTLRSNSSKHPEGREVEERAS